MSVPTLPANFYASDVILGVLKIDPPALHLRRHAGIRDFLCCNKGKSWIPAFAGMTRWVQRRWANL
jgi:hypothetical protein